MRPMHRVVIGLSLLSLAACGPKEQAAPEKIEVIVPAVQTKPLGEVAIYPMQEASAQVISANESELSAEISAKIIALPFDVGQTVPRGAVVLQLDDRDIQLELQRSEVAMAQVKARRAIAQQQLERSASLLAEKFVSPEAHSLRQTELTVIDADLRAAELQIETAKRKLSKTTIKAPFDAIVSKRQAALGELAAPGTLLIALIDRSRLEVSAQVPSQNVNEMKAAQAWTFIGAGQEAELKLLRVSPAVSTAARSMESRFSFMSKTLAPGLEGRVQWRDSQANIPSTYIVRRNDKLGVFAFDQGKARFHALADAQEGRPAVSTLPLETAIIVKGWQALQDGQTIVIAQ